MNAPTAAMKFRWPWRPYQQRVLAEIEQHLEDDKLHIVAAPGSGKTVLGLEVFRRLGRPAVVVSPTITIRNQWVERLRDFVPQGTPGLPDWVSTDLTRPGFFTSITYQALHAKHRVAERAQEDESTPEEEEAESPEAPTLQELREDIAHLRAAGVGTLILDEAHHLRQAWWKALQCLVDELPGLTIVSLTATPPFDVVGAEWERYERLCGPIDAEISVPELVKTGTLCPHQDYVFGVEAKSAVAEVQSYDDAVGRLLRDLLTDEIFAEQVQSHPWIKSDSPDAEQVLDRPEVAFALLIYLNACQASLPQGLVTLVACTAQDLPSWDRRWCEVLLREYLYGPNRPATADTHRDDLARRLRRDGLLWRQQLRIVRSPAIERKLSLVPEKIAGCLAVCRQEWLQRGALLRQAILTDFILDDDLDRPASTAARLGAWPIMRTLAAGLPAEQVESIALLTGRLVVLHESRLPKLRELAQPPAFEATPLEHLPGFCRLSTAGGSLVREMTGMLSEGELKVLVGTRALLGEGWDAPCVNSLILATYVGSFVQTNQLRGRAIRKDPRQPDKAAAVWHLAAMVPSAQSGDSDLTDLARRFDTFVGLGANRPVIESGLNRLALPLRPNGNTNVPSVLNEEMFRRLAEHGGLKERWTEAIEKGVHGRVLPSVRCSAQPETRRFHFNRTLRYLLLTGSAILLSVAGYTTGMIQDTIRLATRLQVDSQIFFWMLVLAAGGSLLRNLPSILKGSRKVARAFRISLRHLPVDGSVRQIASALHEALKAAGVIKHGRPGTGPEKSRSVGDLLLGRWMTPRGLSVLETEDGRFTVALTDAPFQEQEIFADAMAEVLGPVHNPRYLIVRESGAVGDSRNDYHAVPQILGSHKDRAQALFDSWTQRVGPAQLVYTRTPAGRALLLKARAKAFSAAFADSTERRDRWQ